MPIVELYICDISGESERHKSGFLFFKDISPPEVPARYELIPPSQAGEANVMVKKGILEHLIEVYRASITEVKE